MANKKTTATPIFDIVVNSINFHYYGKVLNCMITQNGEEYHVSFRVQTSFNHTSEEELKKLALKLFFNKQGEK